MLEFVLTVVYLLGVLAMLGWVLPYHIANNCKPAPVFWNVIIFSSWVGLLFTIACTLYARKVLKRKHTEFIWDYGWEVNL